MIGAIVGTLAIVGVTIAVGVFVDRKIDLLPRPQKLVAPRPKLPGHAAGEAPATAIRAGGAQLATLRATQRCKTCRTLLVADGADDRVRFDGRELLVIPLRCPGCETKRALYVVTL